MNLIIDIGNTLTKVFIFNGSKIEYFQQYQTGSKFELEKLFLSFNKIDYSIISSVTQIPIDLISIIEKKVKQPFILNMNTVLPVKNFYKTPETLGKDRIAGIVGAYNIFPGKNVLVIDAGTAITYDFISISAEYLGGNISPGLTIRFRALNYFTNALPLIQSQENFPFMGTSTNEAILAGVQNGVIFEMNSYIDRFSHEYGDFKVILTGGDTFFFAHKLKCPIFAEPFLVAIGLNRILDYNVEKSK
jgi:type III pantothenate kinase